MTGTSGLLFCGQSVGKGEAAPALLRSFLGLRHGSRCFYHMLLQAEDACDTNHHPVYGFRGLRSDHMGRSQEKECHHTAVQERGKNNKNNKT